MNDDAASPSASKRERRAARRLHRTSGRALLVRTVGVAVFDALAIYVLSQLAVNRSWAILAVFSVCLVLVNWAYLNPRAQASRWLTPGLVLMAIFVMYPVLYTT